MKQLYIELLTVQRELLETKKELALTKLDLVKAQSHVEKFNLTSTPRRQWDTTRKS